MIIDVQMQRGYACMQLQILAVRDHVLNETQPSGVHHFGGCIAYAALLAGYVVISYLFLLQSSSSCQTNCGVVSLCAAALVWCCQRW
jgi:hypothetical protein